MCLARDAWKRRRILGCVIGKLQKLGFLFLVLISSSSGAGSAGAGAGGAAPGPGADGMPSAAESGTTCCWTLGSSPNSTSGNSSCARASFGE